VSAEPVVALDGLSKTYASGKLEVRALDSVSLEIWPGELLAIMGPSGSGKTTLMEILGCLLRPSEGEYRFRGQPVQELGTDALARLRGEEIGFVFQSFNLLPRLDALENAALPLSYRGKSRRERQERAQAALERVGLGHRASHRPAELSGGERQRVAIARALINEPSFILADEPTGNLDSQTGTDIMNLLRSLQAEGNTVVMVTHDPALGREAERQLTLRDGQIVDPQIVAPHRSGGSEATR